MAFSRVIEPPSRGEASQLTEQMAGIGMNFATSPDVTANIEDVLIHASEVGMEEVDLRVLSVLTTWMGAHHAHVNADRLVRVAQDHASARVRAYWAAIGTWLSSDRRLARLQSAHDGSPLEVLPVGTAFQIERRGADERFKGSALRVPAGTLRARSADVLSPEALTRQHPGYRNRVLMGPSWRADVWTVLERDPSLSVAETARRAYCSFATAWQESRDFQLLQQATGEA